MAKERSYDYFWNSDSDRYYDANSMEDWLRPFFRNGVFNGQMQVTANDNMSVTVAAGYGYINGKSRHFLKPTTLDLEVASGTLDRIDSVILRRNETERRIHLVIEKGGNASSPTAPAPIREGAIYDLKLADIYIAAGTVKITQEQITDKRMYGDVCGWVASTVKELDFSQITAQFDTFFTRYKKNIIDQYNLYLISIGDTEEAARKTYQDMKEKLDTLYSQYREYLLQQYNDYLVAIRETEAEATEKYNGFVTKVDDLFGRYKADLLTRYTEYVQEIAGKEQSAESDYQDFQAQLATLLEQYQTKWTTWFGHIKGQLSEDAAGNLQNQIDGIKQDQGSAEEDVANLKSVVEKYVLQNREIINSLSYNQIAILMELETVTQAEVTGTSDNVVIEMFESEVVPVKGYYDGANLRIYA